MHWKIILNFRPENIFLKKTFFYYFNFFFHTQGESWGVLLILQKEFIRKLKQPVFKVYDDCSTFATVC